MVIIQGVRCWKFCVHEVLDSLRAGHRSLGVAAFAVDLPPRKQEQEKSPEPEDMTNPAIHTTSTP